MAEPRLGKVRDLPEGHCRGLSAASDSRRVVISAVTMPVGTARMPQPSIITTLATTRPRLVRGAMSPNPTVVMVVMAQ